MKKVKTYCKLLKNRQFQTLKNRLSSQTSGPMKIKINFIRCKGTD